MFVIAFLFRLAYFVSIRRQYFFLHLQTEPQRYDQWAWAIVGGRSPFNPPFDEAPGFPYFVALLYRLFGHHVAAVAVTNALIDAAGCVALARCARTICGPGRVRWIAAGLAVAYGPFVYFTAQLEPATLPVCVVSFALMLASSAVAASADVGLRRWIWVGFLLGAGLLVRSELVLLLPAFLLSAGLTGGGRALLRVAIAPTAILAGSLAVNIASSGHSVLLTTGSGVNLWLGNNPDSDGVNPFIHGSLQASTEEGARKCQDPVCADAFFRGRATSFMQSQPGLFAAQLGKKLIWTLSRRELPNATDIAWQTKQSWLFHDPWFPLGFGILFPFAALGAVALGRRWCGQIHLIGPIFVAIVTCTLFFTNARFRLVMAPSLIVLAAVGIEAALDGRNWRRNWRRNGRSVRRLACGCLALAIPASVAWADFWNIGSYHIPEIDVNIGVLERYGGQLAAAEWHLRAALRETPQDALAWIQLGLTLEQAGRPEDARAVWTEALSALPDHPLLRRVAAVHLQTRMTPRTLESDRCDR
jgi:hypothetical protein